MAAMRRDVNKGPYPHGGFVKRLRYTPISYNLVVDSVGNVSTDGTGTPVPLGATMTFNTSAINTAIRSAFTCADKAIDARVAYNAIVVELRSLLNGADRDTIKGFVCPVAAKHYGETYADGKWGNSDCAAKRYSNRVIKDVLEATSPASSTKTLIEVPEGVVEAIQAALAGLTKPQMNAAIAAAKAGLSFE